MALNVKVGFKYLSSFWGRYSEGASSSPGIKRGGVAGTLTPWWEDSNYQQTCFFGFSYSAASFYKPEASLTHSNVIIALPYLL